MRRKPIVLVVDDDETTRLTFGGLLADEPYDLAFAADGSEALRRVRDMPPDTILLDIIMPDIDGYEVCRRLKADAKSRHIPIVMVTGLTAREELIKGLNAGADEFLHKPVAAAELRARVRSMLRIKEQYDRLESVITVRKALSRLIVQEMRNPLGAVLADTEALALADSVSDRARFVEDVRAEVLRENVLLNDLLALMRMETTGIVLNRVAAGVNNLLREVGRFHAAVARSRLIDFRLELPPQPHPVHIDVTLVRRMVNSIVAAHMGAMGPGGVLTLGVEYPAENHGLRITIATQKPDEPEASEAGRPGGRNRRRGRFQSVRRRV